MHKISRRTQRAPTYECVWHRALNARSTTSRRAADVHLRMTTNDKKSSYAGIRRAHTLICDGHFRCSKKLRRLLHFSKFIQSAKVLISQTAKWFKYYMTNIHDKSWWQIQPRPVDSLIFVIYSWTIRMLLESFAFEPSTAIAFKSLKSTSWRNFERSERSKVWKLGAFETVDFNPRYLIFVSDFEAFDGSTALRFQRFESNRCRRFERKAFKKRSTLNALYT